MWKEIFEHPFKPAKNFAQIGKQTTQITIHKGKCCLIKRCKHTQVKNLYIINKNLYQATDPIIFIKTSNNSNNVSKTIIKVKEILILSISLRFSISS